MIMIRDATIERRKSRKASFPEPVLPNKFDKVNLVFR